MKLKTAMQVVATVALFPIYIVARIISAAIYKSKAQFEKSTPPVTSKETEHNGT